MVFDLHLISPLGSPTHFSLGQSELNCWTGCCSKSFWNTFSCWTLVNGWLSVASAAVFTASRSSWGASSHSVWKKVNIICCISFALNGNFGKMSQQSFVFQWIKKTDVRHLCDKPWVSQKSLLLLHRHSNISCNVVIVVLSIFPLLVWGVSYDGLFAYMAECSSRFYCVVLVEAICWSIAWSDCLILCY